MQSVFHSLVQAIHYIFHSIIQGSTHRLVRAPTGSSSAIPTVFYVFIGAGAARVFGHFAVLDRSEFFQIFCKFFQIVCIAPNHLVLAPNGVGVWIPGNIFQKYRNRLMLTTQSSLRRPKILFGNIATDFIIKLTAIFRFFISARLLDAPSH